MLRPDELSTKEKALQINLNPDIYGTFAEIGAGQEVARNFFRAGAASQTVAKTISAYDMTFSDEIYGKTTRYVCQERVRQMLDHEYQLLIDRLQSKRAASTTFFAFANTVAAKQYNKNNECHGWIGLKFQSRSSGLANEVILHVRMLDRDVLGQHQALGVIGVNLIYASFHFLLDFDKFILSLMDGIGPERMEIDMIKASGPDFKSIDNRLLCMKLVNFGMTEGVVFHNDGQVAQAAEVFYKRPILVVRGSFRPPTLMNMDMLEAGGQQFSKRESLDQKDILSVAQITLANLKGGESLDENDFLARVDLLAAMGQRVLVTRHHQYHRLCDYLNRFTQRPMSLVIGVYDLQEIFSGKFSEDITIMEMFGQIFTHHTRVYVYPAKENSSSEILNLDNMPYAPELKLLLEYLKENQMIIPIRNARQEVLHIWSRQVMEKLLKGDGQWEKDVPASVAKTVKEKCLFGISCPPRSN